MVRGAGAEDAELARLSARLFGAPPLVHDTPMDDVADHDVRIC